MDRGYESYYDRAAAGTLVKPEAPEEMRKKIKEIGVEMMNTSRETGDRSPAVFNLTGANDATLFIMEDLLHDEMITIFSDSVDQINWVLSLTLTTFLMPINLINKAVFAKLTRINFRLTVSDFLDFIIVTIVIIIWVVVIDYETSDLSYPLFSPEEDQ